MSEDESNQDFIRLIDTLRSNLNATELTLMKFHQSLRRTAISLGSNPLRADEIKSVKEMNKVAEATQAEFANFKGRLDTALDSVERLLQ